MNCCFELFYLVVRINCLNSWKTQLMRLMIQLKNRLSKNDIVNCFVAVVKFPFYCGRNVSRNIRFEVDVHIYMENNFMMFSISKIELYQIKILIVSNEASNKGVCWIILLTTTSATRIAFKISTRSSFYPSSHLCYC